MKLNKPETDRLCSLCHEPVTDGKCGQCIAAINELNLLAQRACDLSGAKRTEFAQTLTKKNKRLAQARAVWCAAVRHLTGMSYPQIGEILGADHSTVLLAERRAKRDYQEQIDLLVRIYNGAKIPVGRRRHANVETFQNKKARKRWTSRKAQI